MSDRGSERGSTADREGVVDQQDTALERMDDDGAAVEREGGGSAPDRAGAVDQQGALAEDMADDE